MALLYGWFVKRNIHSGIDVTYKKIIYQQLIFI